MASWMLWLLRTTWVLIPLVGGPAIGRAFGTGATATVATTIAWLGFAVGLAAVAMPRSLSLTAMRIVVPASVPLGVFVLLRVESELGAALTCGLAVTATALALSADVGDRFADGSSYGPERRMLLRPPAVVALGLAPLAWALLLTGLVSGPMLLAGGHWLAGSLALLVGLPIALVLVNALHRLTQRWLVFVPAGLVVVDHVTLIDPVLIPIRQIRGIGPVRTDAPDRLPDLTAGAIGMVLGVATAEPLVIARVTVGDEPTAAESVHGVLVSPSRPGAVLAEAESRSFPLAQRSATGPG